MGRHGHREGGGRGGWGRGFGGMGGGGMGGDGEGDEFTRGRKLSSMDLQLLLLAMLAEKPAHGYELIKAIETLSNGFYAPSPGMVYPALTYLEELGHLLVIQEGNRKSYSLSDTGHEHLGQNKERVEAMLSRLAHIGAKMDSMRRAYSGEGGADFDGGGWLPELIEAKHKLKSALFQHDDKSPAEQKRIAAILQQAAKDISGG
jgi:DNA-binding PadR family transcriptional regulator